MAVPIPPMLTSLLSSLFENVRSQARRFFAASEHLLLPPRCAYCNDDNSPVDDCYLCGECRSCLVAPLGSVCRRCSAVTPIVHPADSPDCIRCSGDPWHVDRVVALGHYRGDLRAAILRAKLAHEEPLARTLGSVLAQERRGEISALAPDVILPIPMHWTRQLARGVNPAETIADQIAKALRIRMEPGVLRRVRPTQKLGYISRHKRFQSIRGALSVSSAFELTGAKILLVDDILTTGVTANEAAKVLRKAGAGAVSIAIVARAESDH